MSTKIERINSELRKAISLIIDRELNNPKIDGMISLLDVDTTADLGYCKIKVAIMGNSIPTEEIINALNHSSGFIKNQLKSRVNIRTLPKLIFSNDIGHEHSLRIAKVLDEIKNNKE